MKIAICNVQEFNPTIGGIERVSVSLARELIRAGMEVFFIACRKSPYSEAYELPARQVFLPGPEDYSEHNVESMARIIREEKADILLNQNSHSELYNRTCAEVKRATGVRLVSELHFSPDARIRGNRNRFDFHHLSLRENIEGLLRHACTLWPLRLLAMRDQRRMMCNLYRDSDLTVLLSNEFKAPFMKIAGIKEGGASKLTAINNMLSFAYEEASYPKKKQILWCGRLLFSPKRPDRMLLVWQELQHKLPDWNLVVVGDGPFSDQARRMSRDLGLERIEFTGFQDPVPYYRESAIFCMTSNHEGFGMVLLEAMQYGCVPVAFQSFDSITDIIRDGDTGFLIRPFDMRAYAAAVLRLAREGTAGFAARATASMRRFLPERIAREWVRVMGDVMKKK